MTPAASGILSASERGAESEVAHKWARWLHNPIGRLWRRGAFGARWLLGLIPLTTYCWPEAPWGGGGGVVGVLGPVALPPPPWLF